MPKFKIHTVKSSGIFRFLMFLAAFLLISPAVVKASETEEGEKLNVKEIIFEHLGDGYGWEVPFSHTRRIPLPVIVRASDGQWFVFSSGDLTEIQEHEVNGKMHEVRHPIIKKVERNGKTYQFILAEEGVHKDKVVQLHAVADTTQARLDSIMFVTDPEVRTEEGLAAPEVAGYAYHEGKFYDIYRPWDLSITKNVAGIFIAAVLLLWLVFGLIGYYRRNGNKAPRKGMGFFEMLIGFVYYDTIKATLGPKTDKFAPYLLTAFFFILVMNLVGLIVIFPGGANLTGNIAVTLVLAIFTFVMTNIFGSKHYWKEIFWPDVPLWLKCPLPIMQFIEIFGIFTKPAALCIRLFANMMGGHMIVITLTLLIFIFAEFGMAAMVGAPVISVLFSVFMLLLDVLVSFIQAYVFTLLSSIFIAGAQLHEEEHHAKKDADNPTLEAEDQRLIAEEKAALAGEAASIDLKN